MKQDVRINSAIKATLVCLFLTSVTLAVWWPVVRCDFVNIDDPDYISNNPHVLGGVSLTNLLWAFQTTHAGNWHPLTWVSHMLDITLFGPNPGPQHFVNLVFHAVNVALLFLLLCRTTGSLWRSGFVAALFALHPLHVESVAWISERKDVLSTCFGLLALIFYAQYVTEQSRVKNTKPTGTYVLSLFFFALGLLSKPMLVTWPLLMLLLDIWPLQRLDLVASKDLQTNIRRLLQEKILFFLFAAISCMVTLVAQNHSKAIAPVAGLPLWPRMENAVVSYFQYVLKMVWPARLAVFYPHPDSNYLDSHQFPAWQILALTMLFVGICVLAARHFWRKPYVAFGWFWFVGTLVPVIGIIQVGGQAMADRYSYVPLIGLFILITWGTAELSMALRGRTLILTIASITALIACSSVTRAQIEHWRNGEMLFSHAAAVTERNTTAHFLLGSMFGEKGNFDLSAQHFRAVIEIDPTYADAHYNLGWLFMRQGRPGDAVELFSQELQLNPNHNNARLNIASAYFALGAASESRNNFADAISYYRACLRFTPEASEAINNLAWLLATAPEASLRDGPEAVRLAERSCEITRFETPLFVGTLAAAYAEAGRYQEAVSTAKKAIALASSLNEQDLVGKNLELMALYREGKPYREIGPPKP